MAPESDADDLGGKLPGDRADEGLGAAEREAPGGARGEATADLAGESAAAPLRTLSALPETEPVSLRKASVKAL